MPDADKNHTLKLLIIRADWPNTAFAPLHSWLLDALESSPQLTRCLQVCASCALWQAPAVVLVVPVRGRLARRSAARLISCWSREYVERSHLVLFLQRMGICIGWKQAQMVNCSNVSTRPCDGVNLASCQRIFHLFFSWSNREYPGHWTTGWNKRNAPRGVRGPSR